MVIMDIMYQIIIQSSVCTLYHIFNLYTIDMYHIYIDYRFNPIGNIKHEYNQDIKYENIPILGDINNNNNNNK